MSDANLILTSLAVTIAGMAACALTMDAHWRQILGHRPREPALLLSLRTAGALLLGASFWLCGLADPMLMAILVWPMLLMVSAAIVAAALTLHKHLTKAAPKAPCSASTEEA